LAAAPFGARLVAALPPCPVKVVVGIPCPSCGTARAALALARLDFVAALAWNPLAAFGWIVLIAGGLAAGVWALAGRELPESPRELPWIVRLAAVALLLVNWAYLYSRGV
jgi:hypothetical protein